MEWINVEDELPEQGQEVVAWGFHDLRCVEPKSAQQCKFKTESNIDWFGGWSKGDYITHWISLPEPPTSHD